MPSKSSLPIQVRQIFILLPPSYTISWSPQYVTLHPCRIDLVYRPLLRLAKSTFHLSCISNKASFFGLTDLYFQLPSNGVLIPNTLDFAFVRYLQCAYHLSVVAHVYSHSVSAYKHCVYISVGCCLWWVHHLHHSDQHSWFDSYIIPVISLRPMPPPTTAMTTIAMRTVRNKSAIAFCSDSSMLVTQHSVHCFVRGSVYSSVGSFPAL